MGNTHSIAGHACFLNALDNNTDLVTFRDDVFYNFRGLPSYNLAYPVHPAVITYPERTAQVAEIVRCAIESNHHVQAYSGGHSYGNYGMHHDEYKKVLPR
jgi:FAD/FMN-containing dehydrogenase